MSFIIGKKMNDAACSWGWFICWLKQEYKATPIEITDSGETAKIKIKKLDDTNWFNTVDTLDILRTMFKYHYLAEQAYGSGMTPDAFEEFANEWWRELLSVVITNGKDEILIKKY